jgi:hypothetical protein
LSKAGDEFEQHGDRFRFPFFRFSVHERDMNMFHVDFANGFVGKDGVESFSPTSSRSAVDFDVSGPGLTSTGDDRRFV